MRFAWGELTVEAGMIAVTEDDGFRRPGMHGHLALDNATFDRVERSLSSILETKGSVCGALTLAGASLDAQFSKPKKWVHPAEIVRTDRAKYMIHDCNFSSEDASPDG